MCSWHLKCNLNSLGSRLAWNEASYGVETGNGTVNHTISCSFFSSGGVPHCLPSTGNQCSLEGWGDSSHSCCECNVASFPVMFKHQKPEGGDCRGLRLSVLHVHVHY